MGFLSIKEQKHYLIQTDKFEFDFDDNKIIGFNLKFDLHWAIREGLTFDKAPLWDCQYAHFLLTNQKNKFPSLDDVAKHYGLSTKLDVVRLNYWEKGIDTPDVPREIMTEYLTQDLNVTYQVYLKQIEDFKKRPKLYTLFQLGMRDQRVLLEMEYNGLLWDEEVSEKKKVEVEEVVQGIEEKLKKYHGSIPINYDSPDQLSALIYGGTVVDQYRVPNGTYKSGAKAGQIKFAWKEQEYQLERLVEPLKKTALKKEGLWATNEKVLRRIKHPIASLILERSKQTKLHEYCVKMPKLISEMDWPEGVLHGTFNQCAAATGRLSSTDPNLQNFDSRILQAIRSRYND